MAMASRVFATTIRMGGASSLASVAGLAGCQDGRQEQDQPAPTPTRLSAVLRSLWPRCRSTATAGAGSAFRRRKAAAGRPKSMAMV